MDLKGGRPAADGVLQAGLDAVEAHLGSEFAPRLDQAIGKQDEPRVLGQDQPLFGPGHVRSDAQSAALRGEFAHGLASPSKQQWTVPGGCQAHLAVPQVPARVR